MVVLTLDKCSTTPGYRVINGKCTACFDSSGNPTEECRRFYDQTTEKCAPAEQCELKVCFKGQVAAGVSVSVGSCYKINCDDPSGMKCFTDTCGGIGAGVAVPGGSISGEVARCGKTPVDCSVIPGAATMCKVGCSNPAPQCAPPPPPAGKLEQDRKDMRDLVAGQQGGKLVEEPQTSSEEQDSTPTQPEETSDISSPLTIPTPTPTPIPLPIPSPTPLPTPTPLPSPVPPETTEQIDHKCTDQDCNQVSVTNDRPTNDNTEQRIQNPVLDEKSNRLSLDQLSPDNRTIP